MKEVGVQNIEQRYLEVWNKVDLVQDEDAFQAKLDKEAGEVDYPIVLLSATSGYNKKVFLNELAEMVSRLLGKNFIKLSYPAWEHDLRVKWLVKFA